jgi:Calx-beta domain
LSGVWLLAKEEVMAGRSQRLAHGRTAFAGAGLATFLAAILALGVVGVDAARAQAISLTTLGSAYTQNFDTLGNVAGTTTNNLTIPGWFMTEGGGGARDNEQYAVDTGGSTTGDTYSYGAPGSTERALGGLRTGTLIPQFGAAFTNNTGSTIRSVDVAYTGEEWRLGTAGRTDQLNFEYSTNATDLVTGTWTNAPGLNFVTPDTATVGAKNGNAAASRTALSASISGLSIPNGATAWIRWTDVDATGADDGLAVDDFSLTPQGGGPPLPNLVVNDVAANEGDAGITSFVFTVSLSAQAGAGGATFDIATADGTATSPSDLIASSLTAQTIPAGSSTHTFTVTVNGDTTIEQDETFFVNVTNVTGANVADGQGQGTILNDDVDDTPPDTAIDSGPADPSGSADASFTFSGTDAGTGIASFQCKLDAGSFAACTSPQSYSSLNDGEHTFEVRAIDGAGNLDLTPASFTWTIDTSAPDTAIDSKPSDPSRSSSPSLSFSGTDAGTGIASFQCKLDTGSFAACTSPQSYIALSDGQHTFEVRAVDGAGNADATPASVTWTIDATAPSVTIEQASGQEDPTSAGAIDFTVKFSEPVTGFSAGDVSLTGTAGASRAVVAGGGTTYSVSVNGMTAAGTVTASIPANAATDAAGNANTASTSTDNTVTFTSRPSQPPPPPPTEPAAVMRLRTPRLSVFGRSGSRADCRMRTGRIRSCSIRLLVGRRILARGGATSQAPGRHTLSVTVKLTRFGRTLLAHRLGGVRSRIRARGATSGGARTARAYTRAVLRVERFTTPAGSWVPGRAGLTARGQHFVHGLRGKLIAVASLRCDGHDANLHGTAVTSAPLSRARAAVMCRALRQLGVRARPRLVGHGESEPISSNTTASGRAKNRRVEVTITHRPRRR